jgi:hypothetical protein
MRKLALPVVCMWVLQSCAHLGVRVTDNSSDSGASSNNSGNSSNNSGNSSNNSSGNSGQSSGQSVQSSDASKGTSDNSNQSSQNSRHSSDSNASSKQSSNNTTDSPNTQYSSEAVAATALLVTTGVGVALTLYFVLRKRSPAPEPEKLSDEAKPAQAWLKANRRQLKQDLALGAGPALMDLASVAQIRPENLPRFCKLLSAHRRELVAPLNAELSLEQAAQVMERIGELTVSDPVLKADADAWLLRHPEAG